MVLAPPKPWERNQSNLNTSLPNDHPPITSTNQSCPVSNPTMTGSSSSTTPELPPRPTTMSNPTGSLISNDGLSGLNSGYGANYAGASPYGSRFGGYGLNSGYGGYGGYSRMGGLGSYGGYSGYTGMGGIGGMGGITGGGYGGYMGGIGDPNSMYQSNGLDPNGVHQNPSLTQTLTNSTQSTFQLLQSLVMTFSGFSQLLESTFMMTHSSFFTFVQLIDQFNFFKFSIGKILSLFDLIKWTKRAFGGGGSTNGESWGDSFKSFDPNDSTRPNHNKTPRPSRKPIVIFFLTIFGIPYLMNKLIKAIAVRQAKQEALRLSQDPQAALISIDPNQLTFVKSIHPYHSNQPQELNFNQSEIIAVISPVSKEEREKFGWWRGRLRNGKMGWFPKNYVEEISSSIVSSNPNPNSNSNQAQAQAQVQVQNRSQSQKMQIILDEEAERAKQLQSTITPNY